MNAVRPSSEQIGSVSIAADARKGAMILPAEDLLAFPLHLLPVYKSKNSQPKHNCQAVVFARLHHKPGASKKAIFSPLCWSPDSSRLLLAEGGLDVTIISLWGPSQLSH